MTVDDPLLDGVGRHQRDAVGDVRGRSQGDRQRHYLATAVTEAPLQEE